MLEYNYLILIFMMLIFRALNDVEYRISDLRPTTSGPSAPPMEALSSPEQPASVLPAENGDNTWEDATTLISIPEGITA